MGKSLILAEAISISGDCHGGITTKPITIIFPIPPRNDDYQLNQTWIQVHLQHPLTLLRGEGKQVKLLGKPLMLAEAISISGDCHGGYNGKTKNLILSHPPSQ